MAEQNQDPMKGRYPMLEALLDQEKPDLAGLRATYEKLQDLAKNGSGNKEKHAAAAGEKAYETFFNLMGHFGEVKEHLLKEMENSKE